MLNLSSIVLFVVLVAVPAPRRGRRHGGVGRAGPRRSARFGRRATSAAGRVVAARGRRRWPSSPRSLLGGRDLRLAQVDARPRRDLRVDRLHHRVLRPPHARPGVDRRARRVLHRRAPPTRWDLPVAAWRCSSAMAVALGRRPRSPGTRRCAARACSSASPRSAWRSIIDRFVFNAELFQGGPGGLGRRAPHAVRARPRRRHRLLLLRAGRGGPRAARSPTTCAAAGSGRVLAAMRDSETAAQSVGIRLRRAKLFVFGVSSAMAGHRRGAAHPGRTRTGTSTPSTRCFGLFWFTAVVVCGVSSIGGGDPGRRRSTSLIPRWLDLDIQSAIGIFGLGAVFLGRLPGGVVAQRPADRPLAARPGSIEQYQEARRRRAGARARSRAHRLRRARPRRAGRGR